MAREAVPEAGTMTTATLGDERRVLGFTHTTPFSTFGAWGWDLAGVHIHTWHV